MNSFTPTKEQAAIIGATARPGDEVVVVRALAGTGKTTTLREVAKAIGKRFPDVRLLYIAFNKSVQIEASATMPGNVEAITANALAHRGVPRSVSSRTTPRSMRLTELKDLLALNDSFDHEGVRLAGEWELARLVQYSMREYCLSADPVPTVEHVRRSLPSCPEVRRRLDGLKDTTIATLLRSGESAERASQAGAEAAAAALSALGERVVEDVSAWWEMLFEHGSTLAVTFDQEMKYWALSGAQLSQPGSGARRPVHVVLLDEAQDVNDVLGALVADQRDVKTIIVGDSNQAIYGWRGAKDYMDKFPGAPTYHLTESFRFGPRIAREANRFLALLGVPDGERLIGRSQALEEVGPLASVDAILCRTNGELLSCAVEARMSGKRVGVPKGMKGELDGIVKTVGYLQSQSGLVGYRRRPVNMATDLADFEDWDEVLDEAQADPHGAVARIVRLMSKIDLYVLEDLVQALVEVDPESRGPKRHDILVSTAHKAKGLEWDKVRIASDFPGPKTDKEGVVVMPSQEELKLAYVAVTRARQGLDLGSLSWAQRVSA